MNISDKSEYIEKRNELINKESELFFGAKQVLNDNERKLDNMIVLSKTEELESSYKNSSNFLPKQHFFKSKNKIEKTKIFEILKKLPKGHLLHIHLLAAASVDFIIKVITYKENLYGKFINGIYKLKFMKKDDAQKDSWTSLAAMREEKGDFDVWLRNQLSMVVENPEEAYGSLETVWVKFRHIFSTVFDMLAYKPAFEEFYYQCLKELYDDNITYVEFRATPMKLYDLDDTVYKTEDFFQLLLDVEEKFKKNYTDFFGARYIHSIYRGISDDNLDENLKELAKMKQKFPKLIVGLDFVGFEEEHNLLDLCEELLSMCNDCDFYFHAGETNWFGHTDLNMFDAVLMRSKRIGHGFALPKHPVLMEKVLEQNICVELCPISNQVLLLNDDPRNHPLTVLLAKNYPVVVCSDDPSYWDASGLSYDWYVTFMAMTPKNCGLKFLKQLALNSIQYSALDDDDKKKANDLWTRKWNNVISELLKYYQETNKNEERGKYIMTS